MLRSRNFICEKPVHSVKICAEINTIKIRETIRNKNLRPYLRLHLRNLREFFSVKLCGKSFLKKENTMRA